MPGGRTRNHTPAKYIGVINHVTHCIEFVCLDERGNLILVDGRPVVFKTEEHDVPAPQPIQQPIVSHDAVPIREGSAIAPKAISATADGTNSVDIPEISFDHDFDSFDW
jgi:hypothetical protein